MMLAAPVQAAEDLTLSLWVSPKHPVARGGYDPLVKDLKAGGKYNVKYFTGGALLGAKPTLGGLRDGVAQIGMIALTYFPAEMPLGQLVADLGMSTPDNLTAALAVSEFNMLHCPECQQDFAKQNTVYTGTYSTSPYTIISKTPINSVADLKGKKMRVPGSLWSRWAQSVGGLEVNVPSDEMYEGLNKGQLDIAIQAPGALRSYGLWDTAKYVTLLNLGTYHSLSLMTFNRDFWKSMTPDERKKMLIEAARSGVDVTKAYTQTDVDVLELAKGKGVTIIQPSDELRRQKRDFAKSDLRTVAKIAMEKHHIAKAEEKIQVLLDLLDKWQAIVEKTGGDRDKLIATFRTEVTDKIDTTKYGL